MSNYHYGFALDAELDYRRDALRRDAQAYRLARKARRAVRSTRQSGRTAAVRSAPAGTETSTQPATHVAGSVEQPVARAA